MNENAGVKEPNDAQHQKNNGATTSRFWREESAPMNFILSPAVFQVQAYLILLHFSLMHFIGTTSFFFMNWKFGAACV